MKNFDQVLRGEIPNTISVEENHAAYRIKTLNRAKAYRAYQSFKKSAKFLKIRTDLLDVISSGTQ
jgi:hypothetical protein